MHIKSADLDQRRSFSFSSFDFNSSNSGGLFSSSDDEFSASNFVMYGVGEDDDDDDGAYIEINLDPRATQKTVRVDDVEEKESNSSEVELLRISFSSAGIPPIETTCGTTQHAQGTTMIKPRLGLFVSLARIVKEFMAKTSNNSVRAIEANGVAHQYGGAHLPPVTEMVRTRKDCTMVANSKRNGIMNLFVKLKYKNIPSTLVFMVTPKAKSGKMRARQPLLQRGSSTCRNQDLNRDKTTSSVAGIINFKAMRGVVDALIFRTSRYYTIAKTGVVSSANKQNKSKSCPSSIKSSPMHCNVYDDEVGRFYSRDNSVQAAIAHCKKSFGSQVEFDIHL